MLKFKQMLPSRNKNCPIKLLLYKNSWILTLFYEYSAISFCQSKIVTFAVAWHKKFIHHIFNQNAELLSGTVKIFLNQFTKCMACTFIISFGMVSFINGWFLACAETAHSIFEFNQQCLIVIRKFAGYWMKIVHCLHFVEDF